MLQWLPEDVSTFGQEIDSLFYLIYYITAATFILVTVLMVVFLIKYRDQGGRRATYSHGNTTLEIIWTIIPAVILIVLAFMSASTWAKMKRHVPDTRFRSSVSPPNNLTGKSVIPAPMENSAPTMTSSSITICMCRCNKLVRLVLGCKGRDPQLLHS